MCLHSGEKGDEIEDLKPATENRIRWGISMMIMKIWTFSREIPPALILHQGIWLGSRHAFASAWMRAPTPPFWCLPSLLDDLRTRHVSYVYDIEFDNPLKLDYLFTIALMLDMPPCIVDDYVHNIFLRSYMYFPLPTFSIRRINQDINFASPTPTIQMWIV